MITERAWFLYWWMLRKWVILSYKHIIIHPTAFIAQCLPSITKTDKVPGTRTDTLAQRSNGKSLNKTPAESDGCNDDCITRFRRTTFDPTIRRSLLEEGHIWAEIWKVKQNQQGKIWGENSPTLNALYPQLYSARASIKTQNKDDRDAESYLILGRNQYQFSCLVVSDSLQPHELEEIIIVNRSINLLGEKKLFLLIKRSISVKNFTVFNSHRNM